MKRNLLQTLIAADLVDEYRPWICPVVLGKGKRLFENGVPPRSLPLVETQRTTIGVLINQMLSVPPRLCVAPHFPSSGTTSGCIVAARFSRDCRGYR